MKPKTAAELHQNIPPDWYERGIKENIFQRFWHYRRFKNVGELTKPTGGKILDIGCADGTFTKVILDYSKADLVVGIDVLPPSVAYAKKKFARSKKLRFRVAQAEDLPFDNNEFDAVFALEVLEHVFKPEKVLAEIKRVLKKGGYVVFLVPSENLLFRIIWFFWVRSRGKIWKGTHIQKFDQIKLEKLIKKSGLIIVARKFFLLGMIKAVKAQKK
ncbi:MAG TPA: class I SAM-dependent methyltransferase [Patescibacteria group bacterium]|nr:class I SAM-dependent methyltransferase [Patescibacteria group bacterium]